MAEVHIGAAAVAAVAPLVWAVARLALRPFLRREGEKMPQTSSRRRRRAARPGKVAVHVTRLVAERSRLLAIRAELAAAFEADVAELRAAYLDQVAPIGAALRDLDRGVLPQPPGAGQEGERL